MGRLKTVSLILILGAWGAAAHGAALDDAATAPPAGNRPAPPARPIRYLEAGARLFNSAQTGEQLKLASKYLEAANLYRDQLQPDEQATLDAYMKELAKAKAIVASQPAAAAPAPAEAPPSAVQKPTAPAPANDQSNKAGAAAAAAAPNPLSTPFETRQRGAGCCTKRASSFTWATTPRPSTRPTRPRPWA